MISKRVHRQNDRGFVMVLVAISLLALTLMIGFAVDLGAWYLAASRIQRAADAAALSAVEQLPDADNANAEVDAVLKKNGITTGPNGVNVTVTPNGSELTVKITNDKVPTYFLSWFMKSISITRVSSAERSAPSLSMGSPYNVLGMGSLNLPGLTDGPQNYWLAVNGECAPAEDGDPFDSIYDGNKVGWSPSGGWSGGSHRNCDPASVTAEGGTQLLTTAPTGYNYFVTVPPGETPGHTISIRIYDASYATASQMDPNYRIYNGGSPVDPAPEIGTTYAVYDTNTTPSDDSDDIQKTALVVPSYTVGAYSNPPGDINSGWTMLYTIPWSAAGGTYRIHVYPQNDYFAGNTAAAAHNYGANTFGLIATEDWLGNPYTACDTRKPTDTECPRLYARDAMSVLNNLSGGSGGRADFYFAELSAAYANTTVSVFLWDPGEGVKNIEVLAPDDSPLTFDWSTSPDPGISGLTGTGISLDTSGTVSPSQFPYKNESDDAMFNDRLVTLKIHIPADYASHITGTDDWLKMRYTLGDSPNDRTTWGAAAPGGNGTVPRLVRSAS